jgi:hypothetical protein
MPRPAFIPEWLSPGCEVYGLGEYGHEEEGLQRHWMIARVSCRRRNAALVETDFLVTVYRRAILPDRPGRTISLRLTDFLSNFNPIDLGEYWIEGTVQELPETPTPGFPIVVHEQAFGPLPPWFQQGRVFEMDGLQGVQHRERFVVCEVWQAVPDAEPLVRALNIETGAQSILMGSTLQGQGHPTGEVVSLSYLDVRPVLANAAALAIDTLATEAGKILGTFQNVGEALLNTLQTKATAEPPPRISVWDRLAADRAEMKRGPSAASGGDGDSAPDPHMDTTPEGLHGVDSKDDG